MVIWPWPLIYKSKCWKSHNSGMGCQIDMERKGWVNWMLDPCFDFHLWPHPWPWASHLAGLSEWNCIKNCAVHQAWAGVAKPNSMLLVKWQHLRNEVVFIWNTLWRINNGGWDGYKGWEEATIANVFSLYWMLKWCMYMMTLKLLTHCGLVTPHGDIYLCHNWLR